MDYYHFTFVIVEADRDISSTSFTIAIEKGIGDYSVSMSDAEKSAINLAKAVLMKRMASYNPKYDFRLRGCLKTIVNGSEFAEGNNDSRNHEHFVGGFCSHFIVSA